MTRPPPRQARPGMTGLGQEEQLPGAEAERPRRVEFRRTAEARIMIEQARLLTLKAAWMMDHHGNRAARAEIAMIKAAAANMPCRVID
jgi:alkylation response protein AidB-like acyl-CoA dehydrogenase